MWEGCLETETEGECWPCVVHTWWHPWREWKRSAVRGMDIIRNATWNKRFTLMSCCRMEALSLFPLAQTARSAFNLWLHSELSFYQAGVADVLRQTLGIWVILNVFKKPRCRWQRTVGVLNKSESISERLTCLRCSHGLFRSCQWAL